MSETGAYDLSRRRTRRPPSLTANINRGSNAPLCLTLVRPRQSSTDPRSLTKLELEVVANGRCMRLALELDEEHRFPLTCLLSMVFHPPLVVSASPLRFTPPLMGWLGLGSLLLVLGVLEWQHLQLGRWIALPEFIYAKSIGWPALSIYQKLVPVLVI
jgi:hypothetical protein